MLRYHNFDIVFQEVPGEVTLAINLTGCPNRCPGCHSPHLQADGGTVLDQDAVAGLLKQYGRAITCVCFMGGDAAPDELVQLVSEFSAYSSLKWAWYSGKNRFPVDLPLCFDFVKTGPYISTNGGLTSSTTNQRFYVRSGTHWKEQTSLFRSAKNQDESG